MRYLYIDTSSSYLYSSIVEDDKCIASVIEEFGQSLSEVALPRIVEMFEKNNLSPDDVDKIIVVNGPGSFTGTRIGVTIAKVYAWSKNIPISTVTSLEVMAVSSPNKKVHVPIINARRGFVYGAIFNSDYSIMMKPQHIELSKLKSELNSIDNYEFISNDEFDEELELTSYTPDFEKIIQYAKDNEELNPHAVNPEYLKLTEAEESKI